MTELTCAQCRELTAELALDVLPSLERTRALAHLDHCATCRDTVSALTGTVNRLIELLPDAQPPAGFDRRVVSALMAPALRTRRWWIPAAALLVIALAGTGGWVVGRSTQNVTSAQTDTQAGAETVRYAPLTAADRQVGRAYLDPDRPSWIYLSLDTANDTANGTARCELVRRDGSTVPVGAFVLTHGHGAWGGPTSVDPDAFTTARVIDGSGRTLATAHFTPGTPR